MFSRCKVPLLVHTFVRSNTRKIGKFYGYRNTGRKTQLVRTYFLGRLRKYRDLGVSCGGDVTGNLMMLKNRKLHGARYSTKIVEKHRGKLFPQLLGIVSRII